MHVEKAGRQMYGKEETGGVGWRWKGKGKDQRQAFRR